MRVESIIEDLEAQGYFANPLPNRVADREIVKIMKLVFIEATTSEMLIHSPIKGKDFIAGFSSKAETVVWHLVPDSSGVMMETRSDETEFLNTKISLKKILECHVVNHDVVFVLNHNAGQLRGKLRIVSKRELVIASGAKLTRVNLSAIRAIAVENFNSIT